MDEADVKGTRPAIWRESLNALIPTLQAEWQWIVGLIVITGLSQLLLQSTVNMDEVNKQQELIKLHPEILKQNPALLGQQLRLFMVPFIAGLGQLFFISIPSVYVFTVLYLRRVVVKAPPQLSVANFFYWLGHCTLKYLCTLAPIFAIGVFGGVAVVSLSRPTALISLCVVLLPALFFNLYLTFRLFLVSPIALFHREPVLENSWKLTKGKCWRLWWNLVAQSFILLLIFLVPFIALFVAHHVLAPASVLLQIAEALMQDIWQAIGTMAAVVFVCTAYKILLQEKRQTISPQATQP